MKRDLFDGSAAASASGSDSDGEPGPLRINQAYAESFERRKQRELLAQSAQLASSASSASEDEDEDDAAVELDDNVDRVIHDTIRMIQEKDPRIYDPTFQPFEGVEPSSAGERVSAAASREKKPLNYAETVRQRAVNLGPEAAEQSSDDDDDDGDDNNNKEPSYAAAVNEAKSNLVHALQATEDGNDDDFLVPKANKTNPAKPAPVSAPPQAARLREVRYEPPPMASADEQFLWKYLNDRAYLTGNNGEALWTPALREDEAEVERQDEFERRYNFRFEEPNGATIITHGRVVEGSLRRKDDTRKQARERAKERKTEAQRLQVEELKKLKAMRRKAIEDELAKSFSAGGKRESDGGVALAPEDIDEDFDPATWDAKMAAVYNDEYYAQSDDDFKVDEEAANAPAVSSEGDASDGDSHEDKSAAAPVRQRSAAGDDDVAEGGFKYRQVPANSYGLTEEEILLADQATLNRYVSLKRMAPFREKEWHPAPQHRGAFQASLNRTLKDIRSTPKASVKRRRLEILGLPSRKKQSAPPAGAATKKMKKQTEADKAKESRLKSYAL